MKFAVLHKLVSYLLVSSALLALSLSGELPPVALVLCCGAVLGSWFFEPSASSRWGPRLWTIATLAFLVFTLFDVFLGEAGALMSGVNFLLFLLVNKLFNRRNSRDYLQLYVLSFVTMVAAAALNTDLSFAVSFLLYVICATWSLILLHLRREMEENYLLRHTEPDAEAKRVEVQRILHSKRIVSGRFLVATSLLSLGIFFASSLLFLLFPRVGFGFMFGRSRHGVSMAGFSERIELGQFGTIRDNPAVVLRVELPEMPPRERLHWRWRGISFDHYDGRTWRKERTGYKQLKRGRVARMFVVERNPDLRRAHRALVYMEPVSDSHVLFTPGRPLAVQLPQKRTYSAADPRYVRRDMHGDLSLDGDPSVASSYTIWFDLEEARPDDLRAATARAPRALQRRYTQRPPLSSRVRERALEVTRGARTQYDQVLAVERHLRTSYRYTLDLKGSDSRSPIQDFLFEQKEGHCEYFSTAMVMLLRTLEIPARNVNGFLGGEWNPYGRYYTVRQGDAHSWVEVYFEGHGWVPFDPTPPSGRMRRQESGVLAAISAFIDSIRLKWYKYVIEYDLGKQVGFFRGIANWFRKTFSSASLKSFGRDLRDFFGSPWGLAAAAAVAALVVFRILWRRRRAQTPGRRAAVRRREITDLYLKLLDLLRTLGHEKPEPQTPQAFAERLAARKSPLAPTVQRITETYNQVRFGGRPLSDAELREVKGLVRRIAEARRT
jgi:transglutaminase-like putative cysteine protease